MPGEMKAIACVPDPAEAAQWIAPGKTYVVLFDLDGNNGMEQISSLLSGTQVRVLTIATTEDMDLQDRAVLAGACGAIQQAGVGRGAVQGHPQGAWRRILGGSRRDRAHFDDHCAGEGASHAEQEDCAADPPGERQTIVAITLAWMR